MDYLQYGIICDIIYYIILGFKPYYKWITFNIDIKRFRNFCSNDVLNLIINGLPSIFTSIIYIVLIIIVLNLIINGLPSIF